MTFDNPTTDDSAANILREREDQTILDAISILQNRVFNPNDRLCSPDDLRRYMRLRLTNEKSVLFGVVFMHADNRPIEFEILFYGSLTEARVYPRQILERVLHHNAAAVMLVHNKPSGSTDMPSDADKAITRRLQDGLGLFEVNVVDHLIIGCGAPFSFAEHGLL